MTRSALFCLLLPLTLLAFCITSLLPTGDLQATELFKLSESNWDQCAPSGKEVDAIYGDIVVKTDKLTMVIAAARKGRNANMTVRDVGGCIIDFTSTAKSNDQLSCFYPGGKMFQFHSMDKMRLMVDGKKIELKSLDDGKPIQGDHLVIEFDSTGGPKSLSCTNRYQLYQSSPFVQVTSVITNNSESPQSTNIIDSIRADGSFQFGKNGTDFMWANDRWFDQAYGILALGKSITRRGGRANVLSFGPATAIASKEKESITRQLFPCNNLFDAYEVANDLRAIQVKRPSKKQSRKLVKLKLVDKKSGAPIEGANVAATVGKAVVGQGKTDSQGQLTFTLPPKAIVRIESRGRPTIEKNESELVSSEVEQAESRVIKMESPAVVEITTVDQTGSGIPFKAEFIGIKGTKSPSFGPQSMHTSVGNLTYGIGEIQQLLLPGDYRVVVSHGPEFTLQTKEIKVQSEYKTRINFALQRVVNTAGWISADFHSHSSPSGDNTGDQFGRVQNLLAEHVEYAPCTEHNRIDTYIPHLRKLNAEKWMGTCTGMELTGGPLPVNHQNAFPLKMKPRTQDGGGPVTASNPIVQIERLALWDNKSEKLVQSNHPNLVTIYGDKDNDGKADDGFRKMLPFMDVMEVHPPQDIFKVPAELPKRGSRGNVIFNWMQLLNLGYRIPGVVNTDAHYNLHGSGGLRNYVKCSTDEPSKIDTLEIVKACQNGNVVMSTGPFMEVVMKSGSNSAIIGQDIQVSDNRATLSIKVQSAWMEVNRIQIFVNGRALPKYNFRQRDFPKMFQSGVTKFENVIELELEKDAHLIVVAIGENEKVGPVMGPNWGNFPPIAVANPIFADVDGKGFQPNGDLLDSPLPGAKKE